MLQAGGRVFGSGFLSLQQESSGAGESAGWRVECGHLLGPSLPEPFQVDHRIGLDAVDCVVQVDSAGQEVAGLPGLPAGLSDCGPGVETRSSMESRLADTHQHLL